MNVSTTIDKLIEMRMTTMSEMFRSQQKDPKMKDIPFEERFAMLVDAEHASRKSHRKLNRALIQKLADCEYISQYRNIFITGATGSGKTYLACAFGMEACKRFYSVRFTRLPDLLMDLSAAEDRHALESALQKYTKPMLLIIDEWLLFKLRENEARLLLEVIHKRRKKSSTIFCSQYEEKDWYNQICDGESTLADAIMDRISFDSYKINIEYVDKSVDKSMREVYGLNPSEAQ